MKIIIAGAGSVGRYMAEQLSKFGHDIVLIDTSAKAVGRVDNQSGNIVGLVGDGCEVSTLANAGAKDADVIAAVTGDDEDNLVISLLAKQEFGVPRVVARVNNPNNEWMFNEMWGIDVSVSTPHLLTALVEEAVAVGSLVKLLSLEHGKAGLNEVTLAEGSPAIGKSISQLALPRESTVVAVIRDGHVVVPTPDTVLHAADEVLILATGDVESELGIALIGNK
jgi:trk system potassium uptake protein TrkA